MGCTPESCDDTQRFQNGGPGDGCLSWRQSFDKTIATGDTFVEWTYTAIKETRVTGIRVAMVGGDAIDAGEYALLTVKDEEGEAIVDRADVLAFAGNETRNPFVDFTIPKGQTITLRIDLSDDSANDLFYLVALFGRIDEGCGSAPSSCLRGDSKCKPYTTTVVIAQGAGALPTGDANTVIKSAIPMQVFDLYMRNVAASWDVETSTMVAIAQEGKQLSQGADLRTFDQWPLAGPFMVREFSTLKPLNLTWSGDPQAGATTYLLTFTGRRKNR